MGGAAGAWDFTNGTHLTHPSSTQPQAREVTGQPSPLASSNMLTVRTHHAASNHPEDPITYL